MVIESAQDYQYDLYNSFLAIIIILFSKYVFYTGNFCSFLLDITVMFS